MADIEAQVNAHQHGNTSKISGFIHHDALSNAIAECCPQIDIYFTKTSTCNSRHCNDRQWNGSENIKSTTQMVGNVVRAERISKAWYSTAKDYL
eukprot:scaffold226759_cov42-Prasinocladus_malaysianus.AAC.1